MRKSDASESQRSTAAAVAKKNHVHILAVCGYTTAGLALMAKKMGYRVTGSDEDAYPPNSETLTQKGIKWSNFHDPKNLTAWGVPDLVIQGNQIRAGNRELIAARRLGLKIMSDSEFFYELTKKRRRVVVCGSHGKTTTSALIAWILEQAGRAPGFRLGTITKNFGTAVRLGSGREFVFEGDEYTTTYLDRRPKFFHFHPNIAVINNIEWDHPDVFKTREIYLNLFRNYLIARIPARGLIIGNAEDDNVIKLTKKVKSRLVTFGLAAGEYQAKNIIFHATWVTFDVYLTGRRLGSFSSGLAGLHNVKNCLAAIAVGHRLRVPYEVMAKALKAFKGTSRRFEIVGKARGVTVIDDYAHHPTKARETIAAAKLRYPSARIFVIYVPHTYSRTKALLSDYARAFTDADYIVISDIEPARERHLEALIHARDLVKKISDFQKFVFYIPDQNGIIDFICNKAHRGDVVLCMSVRGFNNLANNLYTALGSERDGR